MQHQSDGELEQDRSGRAQWLNQSVENGGGGWRGGGHVIIGCGPLSLFCQSRWPDLRTGARKLALAQVSS